MEQIRLANESLMPAVGLGCWKIPKESAAHAVLTALQVGYRHVDSACDYGNEPQLGDGLRAAFAQEICARDELWVTSKLWNTYHEPQHVQPALERTLGDLGLEYLDLYMVHFPIALRFVPFDERYPPEWLHDPQAAEPRMEPIDVPLHETWRAMEQLLHQGLVRNIGICNVGTSQLRDLLATTEIPPVVLQVELHPFLTQERLLRFCFEQEIAVTGFSPLGAGSYVPLGMAHTEDSVLVHEVVTGIAERHLKTPAQVVLRWALQRGTSIVVKTIHRARLIENLTIFDFELSREEMASISQLNQNRRFNDPGKFCEQAFNTFFPIFD